MDATGVYADGSSAKQQMVFRGCPICEFSLDFINMQRFPAGRSGTHASPMPMLCGLILTLPGLYKDCSTGIPRRFIG
jgi:hypothetical protein